MSLDVDSPLALDGIRVLEVSHTAAAATAGRILADLGAEVHVEEWESRACGECLLPEPARGAFMGGKRSLDASMVEDTAFDVIVDDGGCCASGRPLAPHYSDSPAGRRAVYVQISTFDADSQEGRCVATPLMAEAVSGVSVALGRRDSSPVRLPVGVAESATGVNAAAAALAALLGRTDGERCLVDVSVASVLEHYVGINTKMFEGYPRLWLREGRRSSGSSGPYPAAIFRAHDGFVGLIGRTKADWEALLAAMGNPSWAEDDSYRDPWLIGESLADEVDEWVQDWIGRHTTADIMKLSERFGFIAAPVRSMGQVLNEPQHHERNFWRKDSTSNALVPGLPFLTRRVTPQSRRPRATSEHGVAQLWPSASRILAGVRILDLSWVWAGPMASMILADLGAEVVKVEHPRRPDGSRARGRPFFDGKPIEGPDLEVTPYFHQVGHGKMSFGADITSPEGAHAVRRLARNCDVVIENMRPGVLDRRGLGYEAMSAENPDIIMVSMSVAGQEGALASLRGYAPVMSSMAGLESLVGYSSADVTGMYTFALGDANAGVYGALATIAALLGRERDGAGRWIDLSQLESVITLLGMPLALEQAQRPCVPSGADDDRFLMQGTFSCRDLKWLAITVRESTDLENLGALINSSTADYGQDIARAQRDLSRWLRLMPRDEAVVRLRARGLLVAPVLSWEESALRERYCGKDSAVYLSHPYNGFERIHMVPWRIDGVKPVPCRRAPLLGEHTNEIARKLGLVSGDEEATHEWLYGVL